jgi:hypothetical protein
VTRFVVLAVAGGCLTAFAPAPFPKAQRGGDGDVSLASLQGRWQIVEVYLLMEKGRRGRIKGLLSDVVIAGNKWTFAEDREWALRHRSEDGDVFPIVINNRRRPATFDFLYAKGKKGMFGAGIVRQKGDRVEFLFAFSDDPRPGSFEKPVDCLVLTLKRHPEEGRP